MTVRAALNRLVTAVIVITALLQMIVAAHTGPPRSRPIRTRAAARRWIRRLARITGVHIEVAGRLPPQEGMQVLVANHSSFLDIAALLVADDAVTFVAGADLYRIPLLAGAMRALGTVPIDRRSGGGVHLALPETTVPDGLRLVVFPEGGISPAGQRRSFRRSAFALAIECGATVVPIAIHGSAAVMSRRDKLALRPGRITVEFLRAIPTDGMTMDDRHALTATAECRIYKALYPCDGGELLVTDRAA